MRYRRLYSLKYASVWHNQVEVRRTVIFCLCRRLHHFKECPGDESSVAAREDEKVRVDSLDYVGSSYILRNKDAGCEREFDDKCF